MEGLAQIPVIVEGLRVADSHSGNHPEDDFTPLETIQRSNSTIGKKISFELEGEAFEPDCGSGKKKIKYKKSYYNRFAKKDQQPTSKPNTKSSVRRISKEVVKEKPPVKLKAALVKSNVGKRKRLDEDVASEEVEDEEVVSDEDGDDVDERVSDVKGTDSGKGNSDKEDDDYEAKGSEEDKESEESEESNEAKEVVKDVKTKVVKGNSTKGKKKGVVSKTKKWKPVSDSDSSSEEEKKRAKQGNDVKKKTKKPSTAAHIKRDKYLSKFIDVGFSSLHNVFIDTLPAQLARFVVKAFSGSSYEFKLDKGIIRVTPEQQFHPKPLKDIHASDIAEKLVLAKRVNFMFKVNFLMLFANVMGTTDTMKSIVNLTVLRLIHEDTNVAAID
ncbi:hypothetical protein Tco_0026561 [Tanacetum coccineum]